MAEMTLLLTIVDLLRVDRSERLAGDGVPDLTDDYACFGAISSRATPPISNAMPRKMMALSGWQSAGAPQEANPGSSGVVCQGDGDDGIIPTRGMSGGRALCQGDGDDGMVFCKSQVRLSFSAP